MRYRWSGLNNHQKGAFGKYCAMAEFAMYGYGIRQPSGADPPCDFVASREGEPPLSVEVRAVSDYNLAFIYESAFRPEPEFVFCLVRLHERTPPTVYVFGGHEWPSDDDLLVYTEYKKSDNAFEVRMARSRDEIMNRYRLDTRVDGLGKLTIPEP